MNTNEKDFLNMLADRSPELHAFAKKELDKGCTLHSFHAKLQHEADTVRGWLIGRFGK